MMAARTEIPKYYRISQEIINRITVGELPPGTKIPSENEIIRRHGVSNTTARKTLQLLENEGWALRIKGKGTYVRTRDIQRNVTRILGFNKNMIEAGHNPSTKLLDQQLLHRGYSAIINGRFYALKGPVYKIKRLRFADAMPMMLEERYISLGFCPGIEKMNFEGSLYDIYRDSYGHKLSEVNQMLSAVIIRDQEQMQYFDIASEIPAFIVDGVTFCGKEMILELEQSLYRGDKYRFAVRAT
jgi:GntR family transcriptional regulator